MKRWLIVASIAILAWQGYAALSAGVTAARALQAQAARE